VGDVERVGARLQEHGDADRRLAVERGEGVVRRGAQLDARDVLQPQRAAGPLARSTMLPNSSGSIIRPRAVTV
jgi:hypothetical protein